MPDNVEAHVVEIDCNLELVFSEMGYSIQHKILEFLTKVLNQQGQRGMPSSHSLNGWDDPQNPEEATAGDFVVIEGKFLSSGGGVISMIIHLLKI